ncbi:MAG: ABC transporter ATP-binding protein, partial [Lactobacillus delbrueckii]
DAKEVLEKALADYDGTLLFVSHDRYFINELANKIVVAKDGQAKIYEGNYTYYLNEKAKEEAAAQETAAQEAPVVKA